MSGDKARHLTAGIHKPCAAHVQDRPIRRCQRPIDRVTSAVTAFFHFDDGIFHRVRAQRPGEPRPLGDGETKAQKENRFAAARRMRGVQQVTRIFGSGTTASRAFGSFIGSLALVEKRSGHSPNDSSSSIRRS